MGVEAAGGEGRARRRSQPSEQDTNGRAQPCETDSPRLLRADHFMQHTPRPVPLHRVPTVPAQADGAFRASPWGARYMVPCLAQGTPSDSVKHAPLHRCCMAVQGRQRRAPGVPRMAHARPHALGTAPRRGRQPPSRGDLAMLHQLVNPSHRPQKLHQRWPRLRRRHANDNDCGDKSNVQRRLQKSAIGAGVEREASPATCNTP